MTRNQLQNNLARNRPVVIFDDSALAAFLLDPVATLPRFPSASREWTLVFSMKPENPGTPARITQLHNAPEVFAFAIVSDGEHAGNVGVYQKVAKTPVARYERRNPVTLSEP